MSIKVNRKTIRFTGDPRRVISRFFFPGPETRVDSIIQKVQAMPEEAARMSLNQTLREFSARHRNISRIFQKHFERVSDIMKGITGDLHQLSEHKKLLIGAFFTSEYSIESAAFFNPSIIEDPDQSGLLEGQKRVILSFRATGEGHISSIVFRGGILDANNNIEIRPTGRLIDEAEAIKNFIYSKEVFFKKLNEMEADDEIVRHVMNKLRPEFDYNELYRAIHETTHELQPDESKLRILKTIAWLGDSYYAISFSLDTGISDRVIFPISAAESNGIEDARFVKFTGDDGSVRYYATYTAYNGFSIMPKLLETRDFYDFKIMPIHGENAQNKGMAVFPKKINGKYAMLARLDGVNNYVMFSDDIIRWNDAKMIHSPGFPWEFIQVGNCGSPIETEYGWLVITHGVGTMRKYVLGAILLDLEDPTKVIGRLNEPLMVPNENEREGYVPNVVYSCGSIINNGELVIPYAMSDTASALATISLQELLSNLVSRDLKPGHPLPAESKASILVVEDNPTYQMLISETLKSEGYEVEVAPDGIVALMQLTKNKFDLILSDVLMPNFNGFQLLEYMNENKIDNPVVFLSGQTSPEDEEKGLRMGAIDYIHKPFDSKLLLLRIENIIKGRNQSK